MTGPADPPDLPPVDPPADPPDSPIPAPPVENIHFAHYDLTTGLIIAIGHCEEGSLDVNEALYPTLGFIIGKASVDTDMVDLAANPRVLVPRPVFNLTVDKTTITANLTDTATITGIPAGTTVTLIGAQDYGSQTEVVNSGTTSIKTIVPLPHVLRFTKPTYVTTELTINGV